MNKSVIRKIKITTKKYINKQLFVPVLCSCLFFHYESASVISVYESDSLTLGQFFNHMHIMTTRINRRKKILDSYVKLTGETRVHGLSNVKFSAQDAIWYLQTLLTIVEQKYKFPTQTIPGSLAFPVHY